MLRSKRLKTLRKVWVDNGYQGPELGELAAKKQIDLEVVKRPLGRIRIYNEQWKAIWIPIKRVFTVLPKRWIVERTFAWIGKYRRMSKDYELHPNTSETMIYLSMTRTMLSRYERVS